MLLVVNVFGSIPTVDTNNQNNELQVCRYNDIQSPKYGTRANSRNVMYVRCSLPEAMDVVQHNIRATKYLC
jgi:hypothetical protein